MQDELPFLYYGRRPLNSTEGNYVYVPQSQLIECHFRTAKPEELEAEPEEQFFKWNDGNAESSFDLFGWIFFYLSRMEEYQVFPQEDDLGRFSHRSAFSHRKGWIYRAVVDRWCAQLAEVLEKLVPGICKLKPKREVIPTCDLDIPYALRGKPFFRLLGASIKSLFRSGTHEFVYRLMSLNGKGTDPFDTLEKMSKDAKNFHQELKCFVLLPVVFKDRRDSSGKLLKKLDVSYFSNQSKRVEWGLHPSITAGDRASCMIAEKENLEALIDCEVIISRQHFLRINLPDTYRALSEAGIKEDYSMGYHDSPGFRAGTSRPFFWYDLDKEKVTSLKVYPLLIMDGSLKNHLKLNPREAMGKIDRLIEECALTNGIFSYLWHNSSLSVIDGWGNYIPVYHHLIKRSVELIKNSE